jgi:molybdopterin/thiamine biosynthesis adenylyltransferase
MEYNENEYTTGMLQRTAKFFTSEEINRVRNSTFAICGMGGVGSITVELFARWAIKRFKLLDKDKYEPSNLNRQLFATSRTMGRWKVEAAADRIREINPFVEKIETMNVKLNNVNVKEFVGGADIIIQTGDSPSCKIIYEEARKQKVPLVAGYCYPVGAYAQVYDFRNRDCHSFVEKMYERSKWKDRNLAEMTPEELDRWDQQLMHAPAATIGFVTNITGCLIGTEAIKLLTGKGKVCHYPKWIDFNAFDLTLKTTNPQSVLKPGNYRKLVKVRRKMTAAEK